MVGLLPGGEGAKIIGAENGHIHVDVVRAVGILRCGVESLNNSLQRPWMGYRASSVGLCGTLRSLWRRLLPKRCSRPWASGQTIPC